MEQLSFEDETPQIKSVQQEAALLLRRVEALARIKPQSPSALEDLEKALRDFPSEDTVAAELAELRHRAASILERAGEVVQRAFKPIEAAFVHDLEAAKVVVRQTHRGWRVGSLEMESRPERSQVRFQYNQQDVVGWTPVRTKENLEGLFQNAKTLLERSKIPSETLGDALWQAYNYLRSQRKQTSDLVPIRDAYPELRVALLRHELRARPEKVVKQLSLPMWAFLYNLDLYRSGASTAARSKRLSFVTGAQVDTAKIGVVMNGMQADEEYKVFCYLQASGER
jgi:hypothetical protein